MPHRALIALLSALCLAGICQARDDLDCTKAASSSDHWHCADLKRAEVERTLEAIDKAISARLADDDSRGTGDRAAQYAHSVKSWRDYAWARCRAIHEGQAGAQWPQVHISNCIRHLAEARTRDLCEDNSAEADLAEGACPVRK